MRAISSTANVGIVRGGDWASSVPEECVLEVRIAAYPGAHLPDVQQRFRSALIESVRDDPWLAEHPPEAIGNLDAYLYRTAINAALDLIRSRWRWWQTCYSGWVIRTSFPWLVVGKRGMMRRRQL